MIYKVFYQGALLEVPIRERTQTLYIEADSVPEVRKKLTERNYNIELIQPLENEHLAYEKQSEHFELEQA